MKKEVSEDKLGKEDREREIGKKKLRFYLFREK